MAKLLHVTTNLYQHNWLKQLYKIDKMIIKLNYTVKLLKLGL